MYSVVEYILGLPRSRFLDVTQRSPKRTFSFGGALRDIQKGLRGRLIYTPLDTKNEQVITLNLKNNVFCGTNASICHKTFHQREDLFLLSRGLVSSRS